MRQEAQHEHELPIKMNRNNQPVIIVADVENGHGPSALHFHAVRGRVGLANIDQVLPLRRFYNLAPGLEVGSGLWIIHCRLNQEGLFYDAHAYILYSQLRCQSRFLRRTSQALIRIFDHEARLQASNSGCEIGSLD